MKDDRRDAYGLAEKLRMGTLDKRIFKAPRQFAMLRELARTHQTIGRDLVRVQVRLNARVGSGRIYSCDRRCPMTMEERIHLAPLRPRARRAATKERAMILEKGDKILAAHRRLFKDDQPRFFTGEVEQSQGDIIAATGHSWLRDVFEGCMVRKNDPRTKILSLSSGSLILYRLPREVDLGALKLDTGIGSQVVLTDGASFHMDVSESVRVED